MTKLSYVVAGIVCLAPALMNGCASNDEPVSDSVGPQAGSDTADTKADDAPLRIGVTFEAHYIAETGEFEFFNVEPFAEGLPVRTGDIVSVPQPGYCEAAVGSDGTVGSNPADTFEIYTVDGSTQEELDCFGGGPFPETIFNLYGVRCTDVTVRNFYTTAVDDVHAQIDEMVPADGNRGYAFPYGTGAQAQPGLTNAFGLWSYGDMGAPDGRVGPPGAALQRPAGRKHRNLALRERRRGLLLPRSGDGERDGSLRRRPRQRLRWTR